MNSEDRIPLTDPSQVDADMTEEQAREFWTRHEITEEYLRKAGPVASEELPKFRPRTKPVSVRLDADLLRRLKRLAEVKNKGYQTLLKEFLSERLYEEEKREGIILPSEGQLFERVMPVTSHKVLVVDKKPTRSTESGRWSSNVSRAWTLLSDYSNKERVSVSKSKHSLTRDAPVGVRDLRRD